MGLVASRGGTQKKTENLVAKRRRNRPCLVSSLSALHARIDTCKLNLVEAHKCIRGSKCVFARLAGVP